MSNLIFLYEENGFLVSKLITAGSLFYIVENKVNHEKYIRKTTRAVREIIHSKKY